MTEADASPRLPASLIGLAERNDGEDDDAIGGAAAHRWCCCKLLRRGSIDHKRQEAPRLSIGGTTAQHSTGAQMEKHRLRSVMAAAQRISEESEEREREQHVSHVVQVQAARSVQRVSVCSVLLLLLWS
jgi:hypothetical protein